MATPLRDGYGYDYATGKPVDMRKPEEKVRQDYERMLHLDYGYEKEQMDIEVAINRGAPGSRRRRDDSADIVIYGTTDSERRDQFQDIVGIIETKRPQTQKREGVEQLMSYMSASSARWGVWTNGETIETIYRDPASGQMRADYIFDIPRRGETVEDMGRLSKSDLVPAHTLKPIFYRILQTLYANTNISRRERLGSEMVRLIFAKIWDERFNQESLPEFRVGFNEDPSAVKERIQRLFAQVRLELADDGVFDPAETITLDDKSVTWVVGQLERYSLIRTEKDVVGDAFEVFAEAKLLGEKGEFFTPREVVRTAVELVDPQPGQRILDPACGSGGFLIYAMEHIWGAMDSSPKYRNSPRLSEEKRDVAQRTLFGIDKETDLVKIAKAYMAIAGDGRGGLVQENTLHSWDEFDGRAKDLFTQSGGFRRFDTIFTNPPFGSKIKVLKEQAAQFDLGHKWRRSNDGTYFKTREPKDTEPQILFIERCLEMLEDGGTLAIVLPESIFHLQSYRYVMQFILTGNNVRAVVDLPHNTFRPHNNAKTCLLVLQKNRAQQPHIVMAVAEEMGHDHDGRTLYRYDEELDHPTEEIWDDLSIIRSELVNPLNEENKYTFVVDADSLKDDIYVPRYYWTGLKAKADDEDRFETVTIQQLIDEGVLEAFEGHGSPPSEFKGKGTVPYIRVSDVVNWELYRNPTSSVPEHVYRAVKGKNGVTLNTGDVILVRRGSYRIGTVAMASPFDTDLLLTKELVVLRVVEPSNEYGIDPYYLIYLLSHQKTQAQVAHKTFLDTTLPNIGNRWRELTLYIEKKSSARDEIRNQVMEAIEAKWSALQRIHDLRERLGALTT